MARPVTLDEHHDNHDHYGDGHDNADNGGQNDDNDKIDDCGGEPVEEHGQRQYKSTVRKILGSAVG